MYTLRHSQFLRQGKLVCNPFCLRKAVIPVVTRLTLPGVLPNLHPQTTQESSFHTNKPTWTQKNANEAIISNETPSDGDEGPWMTDLMRRGLYSQTRYGHYHKYHISSLAIAEDKRSVVINWNDGHTSNFDAIWLRNACHCKDCKHDTNGMGKIEWHSLPLDITLLSMEVEEEKMVVLRWGSPDGKELHQGAIPTATLRHYCYSREAIKERRERRAMQFHDEKIIPEVEHEELVASDEGMYKCLMNVNKFGICLVKNTQPDRETFLNTIKLLGPIQSTMYGETFEVYATPNPINAAYSDEKLVLHMDLPFYEGAPGLQILHCIQFDEEIVGGDNTFLDIHEVAHKFREEKPELFDRLARLPCFFNSIHYNRKIPVHMENQRPIFSLNHLGELVSVSWNPMVHGPVEVSKEDMMPFYEAYTAFNKMVYTYESIYRMKFAEGDFLVFNNRRLLHGRDAFRGGRHLLGSYVELHDFHSYTQALCNKYGGGVLAHRPGSHSWL